MFVVILDEMGAREKESEGCPNCEQFYPWKITKIDKEGLCPDCGKAFKVEPPINTRIIDKGHCLTCGKHRGFKVGHKVWQGT